jgi:3-hydroxyacyl-[acyl-carrier-protein] dehydratase
VTALPDLSAISRILPHRYPFLLVDRIIELEPGRRIVGTKLVSRAEEHLSRPADDGTSVMPPTLMMEAVAQVGAVLVLSMPENRDTLAFLLGIDRPRGRRDGD